jgi:Ni/Fe-hydrogenase 1 B-type cytochrome subunit
VLLILVVTGFYIANPLSIMTQKDVSQLYTMGWFRYLHFAAAYLFFFNFMARIYWGFVGNKYASWRQFIPISKQFVSEMWTVIKMDILLLKGSLKDRQHLSVGHNALAGMTYFLTFIMFLVQCLTGFGLYASMSDWWFPNLFSWVPAMLGGDILTRQIHHWVMWFFILFAFIHVYLVFYHDYVEGRGEISSMGGGWKFIEEEFFEKDKPHTPNP